jgi:hypothetical protein
VRSKDIFSDPVLVECLDKLGPNEGYTEELYTDIGLTL